MADALVELIERSAPLVIPTDAHPHYSRRCSLDGRDYTLVFRWNQREEHWYLDLLDAAESRIVVGLKLMTNWPLLRFYRSDPRVPPGELMVRTLTTDDSPPRFDDFGEDLRCSLIYYSQGA